MNLWEIGGDGDLSCAPPISWWHGMLVNLDLTSPVLLEVVPPKFGSPQAAFRDSQGLPFFAAKI